MRFLFDYRYHAEIYKELEQLSEKEKEIYLARLRGEDTIDTLREDLDKIAYERDVYFKVLQRHGLLKEAQRLLEEGRKLSFEIEFDPDEELPFQ